MAWFLSIIIFAQVAGGPNMPMSLEEFLEQGAATSREIQAATGLSQAAVSRQLKRLKDRVVAVRSGRTPRYILTGNAFGGGDRLALNETDIHGDSLPVAYLRPLVTGQFYVEATAEMSVLLLGDDGSGLYDDLPYFLYDMGPQGFLGRQVARHMHASFPEFPADPKYWTADHVGRFLISNGEDVPGSLLFGEQNLLRVRRAPIPVDDQDYPALADNVMTGAVPGSSAGGEQPKFTAFSAARAGHVIVKFSPAGTNDIACRWRDILITEYHALEILRAHGLPAAHTRLLEKGGRLFLESMRFDRIGPHGRSSMISLAAIDAEFVGSGSSWPRVLQVLAQRNLVAHEDMVTAELAWCFGRLINNTDMHLGNLSFSMAVDRFSLLPIYDMCSMGFVPRSGGEVAPYAFTPKDPVRLVLTDDAYTEVRQMAVEFWDAVAGDAGISDALQEFLGKGNPVGMMG